MTDPKEKPVRTQVSGKLQRWDEDQDGGWCEGKDVEKLEAWCRDLVEELDAHVCTGCSRDCAGCPIHELLNRGVE